MNLLGSNMLMATLVFTFLLVVSSSKFFVEGQLSNVYSSQENAAIDKLRSLVGDKLALDYQKTDSYLLRWIRSYQFDIDKAHQHLEKTLKWRKENNMDNILEGDTGASTRNLPYTVNGFDRGGRPLLVMRFGKWALRKYVLAGKRDEASEEVKRMTERILRKVFEVPGNAEKDIDQFSILVDFLGYNVREHLCVACVPLTLDFAITYESHCSPFARNLTLINVPKFFQPVLSLIKQLFGTIALMTLQVYDTDKSQWQPAILNDIAPDQLPYTIGFGR